MAHGCVHALLARQSLTDTPGPCLFPAKHPRSSHRRSKGHPPTDPGSASPVEVDAGLAWSEIASQAGRIGLLDWVSRPKNTFPLSNFPELLGRSDVLVLSLDVEKAPGTVVLSDHLDQMRVDPLTAPIPTSCSPRYRHGCSKQKKTSHLSSHHSGQESTASSLDIHCNVHSIIAIMTGGGPFLLVPPPTPIRQSASRFRPKRMPCLESGPVLYTRSATPASPDSGELNLTIYAKIMSNKYVRSRVTPQ